MFSSRYSSNKIRKTQNEDWIIVCQIHNCIYQLIRSILKIKNSKYQDLPALDKEKNIIRITYVPTYLVEAFWIRTMPHKVRDVGRSENLGGN